MYKSLQPGFISRPYRSDFPTRLRKRENREENSRPNKTSRPNELCIIMRFAKEKNSFTFEWIDNFSLKIRRISKETPIRISFIINFSVILHCTIIHFSNFWCIEKSALLSLKSSILKPRIYKNSIMYILVYNICSKKSWKEFQNLMKFKTSSSTQRKVKYGNSRACTYSSCDFPFFPRALSTDGKILIQAALLFPGQRYGKISPRSHYATQPDISVFHNHAVNVGGKIPGKAKATFGRGFPFVSLARLSSLERFPAALLLEKLRKSRVPGWI